MGRLGGTYGAFDDAMAHLGLGGSYSQTYIVNGRNEAEIQSRGFAAVARNGEGALASVEVHYAPGSNRPSSFVVTTTDPTIQAAITGIGVQQTTNTQMEDLIRQYQSMLSGMGTPNQRAALMDRAGDLLRSDRERPAQKTSGPQETPQNAGRDAILGDVGRALNGTPFSVTDPISMGLSALGDAWLRQRDTFHVPDRGRAGHNEADLYSGPRDGGTGFMRYIEPGGSTSAWRGNTRLYTEYPIIERNAFGHSGDRNAGVLRIYGDLNARGRFEVITDNPALRAAMERARIPVVPATPQQQQPQEQRREPQSRQ